MGREWVGGCEWVGGWVEIRAGQQCSTLIWQACPNMARLQRVTLEVDTDDGTAVAQVSHAFHLR